MTTKNGLSNPLTSDVLVNPPSLLLPPPRTGHEGLVTNPNNHCTTKWSLHTLVCPPLNAALAGLLLPQFLTVGKEKADASTAA